MRGRWFVWSGAGFVVGAVVLFVLAFSYFKSEELQRAGGRVSLYRTTLINALDQFQHLPFVLSHDPYVIAAAEGRDRAVLNRRLAAVADQSGLDAIYLMDRTGLTVAASNHDAPVTFLGKNYGFRPYFQAALAGRTGQFFGIGATTSRPGFFIAEPVQDSQGAIAGVIAIKLDLSALETAWAEGGERVFVSNGDGVVLLASEADWRYRTLTNIPETRRAEIKAGRQFGTEPLARLDWRIDARASAQMDGQRYLHLSAPVADQGWVLHFLADERPVWERTWLSVVIAAVVAALIHMAALFLRSERIRLALRASQADSESLRRANVALAREVEERTAAERRLEKARSELARTSKLAALGQLAASVTHELGQPIAAMRNYLLAAELSSAAPRTGAGTETGTGPGETLARLGRIVERMEGITKQLKFFATPGEDRLGPVDLRQVIRGSVELIQPDVAAKGIGFTETLPDQPVTVHGNRLRLEQVVINLVRNAMAAAGEATQPAVSVTLSMVEEAPEGAAVIRVRDTGPGMGRYSFEQLQEPFVTTRASGEGMGLGLAITTEIVKEHGGRIAARNLPEGGAEFEVELPLAEAPVGEGELDDATA